MIYSTVINNIRFIVIAQYFFHEKIF